MSEVAESVENTESSSMLSPEITQEEQPMTGEESTISHVAGDEQVETKADTFEWGERPEYLPEQFWNDENGPDLEGLAKSYSELRAKMSAGKHKAPKDGKYDLSVLQDYSVSEDDDLLSEFTAFAKENGLSQDQFDAVTSMYAKEMAEIFGQQEDDVEAEMQKLGPKGEKVINSLNQWLGKLGSSGTLSAEEVDAITNAATNANYISALSKIRASYGEQPIPDVTVQEGKGMTKADLDAMVADPRYGKDMHFTQNVERKFMEFFGEA